MEAKQIIEIKGVKMEVDYREGKTTRIDTYRIGSKVKILTKGYGDSYTVRAGIIIGFDEFKQLPTIKILCVNTGYGGGVEYVNFNEGLKDAEVISAEDDEELYAKREDVIETINREIEKKKIELETAQFNLRQFQKYWGQAAARVGAVAQTD